MKAGTEQKRSNSTLNCSSFARFSRMRPESVDPASFNAQQPNSKQPSGGILKRILTPHTSNETLTNSLVTTGKFPFLSNTATNVSSKHRNLNKSTLQIFSAQYADLEQTAHNYTPYVAIGKQCDVNQIKNLSNSMKMRTKSRNSGKMYITDLWSGKQFKMVQILSGVGAEKSKFESLKRAPKIKKNKSLEEYFFRRHTQEIRDAANWLEELEKSGVIKIGDSGKEPTSAAATTTAMTNYSFDSPLIFNSSDVSVEEKENKNKSSVQTNFASRFESPFAKLQHKKSVSCTPTANRVSPANLEPYKVSYEVSRNKLFSRAESTKPRSPIKVLELSPFHKKERISASPKQKFVRVADRSPSDSIGDPGKSLRSSSVSIPRKLDTQAPLSLLSEECSANLKFSSAIDWILSECDEQCPEKPEKRERMRLSVDRLYTTQSDARSKRASLSRMGSKKGYTNLFKTDSNYQPKMDGIKPKALDFSKLF